ncbi:MAG TPA: methyltransferase domain-containing protein [Thermoanaerobaculia bacterium]|jgi:ubiquinone/menaquinone biosynthesis C-methylase UbiE|nr:methyltransferase domain-containing protein [Thermoanaerobaculia bacterium]
MGERFKSLGLGHSDLVVFAGSGGRSNGVQHQNVVHIDIAEKTLRYAPGPLLANVEQLPIKGGSIAAVICVGSVVNYCDAAATIAEFARVIRDRGTLILDFESSDSLEFAFTSTFKSAVDLISTFYNERREEIWVYSLRFIEAALAASGFVVTFRFPIHILSPLRLRFSNDVAAASA